MRDKLAIIILGVFEIVVGILLLVNPIGFTAAIIMVIGIVLVVAGVLKTIEYFKTPEPEASFKKSLAVGILAVLIGMWCIFNNEWFLELFVLLTTLYGIAVLISGVIKLQWTADLIRMKISRWGWMLASAILTLACSVIILADPFSSISALWIFIGVTLIIESILDAVAAIYKIIDLRTSDEPSGEDEELIIPVESDDAPEMPDDCGTH